MRIATSGEDGGALAPALPAPLLVQAVLGDRRSAIECLDRPDEPVVLTLAERFEVEGRVRFLNAQPGPETRRVLFLAESRDERAFLGEVAVPSDGSFGPLELPAVPAERLVARFEGGTWEVTEATWPMPSPGSKLRVELEVTVGGELEVRVVEGRSGGAPIAGARATALWREGDAWRRASARVDESGVARLRGCRFGECWVRAEAEGFSRDTLGGVYVPSDSVVEVVLARPARIVGRCTFGGEPVEDFDVLIARGDSEDVQARSFEGREDGSFEIGDAPPGELALLAFSDELPEGEAAYVTLASGEERRVELELGEPAVAVGRVVDAVTGEPLSKAVVRMSVHLAGQALRQRGPDQPVDAGGRFELSGLRRADTSLVVAAPGYAAATFRASPDAEGRLDFGELALACTQTLELRLVGDESLDAGSMWFRAEGARTIPYARFSPDGSLRIPDVEPGAYTFYIIWPDGVTLTSDRLLVAGRDWRYEYSIRRAEPLVIELLPVPGTELPPELKLNLEAFDARGERISYNCGSAPDGVTQVDFDLAARELTVEVTDLHSDVLHAIVHATLEPGEERWIRVPLTRRVLAVEVVDARGEPLPGAEVAVVSPLGERGWMAQGDCDASGVARFAAFPAGRVYASAQHPLHGSLTHVPVDLSGEGETRARLELSGNEDLALRLVDAGAPLGGVLVALHPPFTYVPSAERSSDAAGIVTFARTGRGDYDIAVDHPGLWPTRRRIVFEGGGEPIPFEVRRLGSLRVRVVAADGAPVAGAALALRGLDPVGELAEWIALRLVPEPAQGLATGADGALLVSGLPRGEYLARVTLPDGRALEATVGVPPKAEALLEFRAE